MYRYGYRYLDTYDTYDKCHHTAAVNLLTLFVLWAVTLQSPHHQHTARRSRTLSLAPRLLISDWCLKAKRKMWGNKNRIHLSTPLKTVFYIYSNTKLFRVDIMIVCLAWDPVLQLSAVYLNALLRSRKTSYLTAEMIDQLLKGFI